MKKTCAVFCNPYAKYASEMHFKAWIVSQILVHIFTVCNGGRIVNHQLRTGYRVSNTQSSLRRQQIPSQSRASGQLSRIARMSWESSAQQCSEIQEAELTLPNYCGSDLSYAAAGFRECRSQCNSFQQPSNSLYTKQAICTWDGKCICVFCYGNINFEDQTPLIPLTSNYETVPISYFTDTRYQQYPYIANRGSYSKIALDNYPIGEDRIDDYNPSFGTQKQLRPFSFSNQRAPANPTDGICAQDEEFQLSQCQPGSFCPMRRQMLCRKLRPSGGPAVGSWEPVCSLSFGSWCHSVITQGIRRISTFRWGSSEANNALNKLSSEFIFAGDPDLSGTKTLHSRHFLVVIAEMLLNKRNRWSLPCLVDYEALGLSGGNGRATASTTPKTVIWQWRMNVLDFNMQSCNLCATTNIQWRPKCLPGCCLDNNCQICRQGMDCLDYGNGYGTNEYDYYYQDQDYLIINQPTASINLPSSSGYK